MRTPKHNRSRGGAVITGLRAAKLAIHPRAEQAARVALTMDREPGQIGVVICDESASACVWLDLDDAIRHLRELGGTDTWTDELRTMPAGQETIVVRLPNGDMMRLVNHPIVKGGAS